jgi:PAS domain-containing protein
MLYNDAYSVFAGGRHPQLLGSNVREGWPEVADFNDNVMKVGLAGGTLAYKDQELTLYRTGEPEQVWMNLDYWPVPGEDGEPAGVIATVVETTARVQADRQRAETVERLELALSAGGGVGTWDFDIAADRVVADDRFAEIYGVDPGRGRHRGHPGERRPVQFGVPAGPARRRPPLGRGRGPRDPGRKRRPAAHGGGDLRHRRAQAGRGAPEGPAGPERRDPGPDRPRRNRPCLVKDPRRSPRRQPRRIRRHGHGRGDRDHRAGLQRARRPEHRRRDPFPRFRFLYRGFDAGRDCDLRRCGARSARQRRRCGPGRARSAVDPVDRHAGPRRLRRRHVGGEPGLDPVLGWTEARTADQPLCRHHRSDERARHGRGPGGDEQTGRPTRFENRILAKDGVEADRLDRRSRAGRRELHRRRPRPDQDKAREPNWPRPRKPCASPRRWKRSAS